jgi:uncharacterized protein
MRSSLVVHVSQIPPDEGLHLAGDVTPAELHLEKEDNFVLEPGAKVDVHLDKGDDESVHVRGTVAARLRMQCARCVKDYVLDAPAQLDLFYLPHQPGDQEEAADEVELSDRDMVVSYYEGDQMDLGEAIREHLFLALPMKRVCREDCAGLCPTCGVDRNESACACRPETVGVDPRLAVLKKLVGGDS